MPSATKKKVFNVDTRSPIEWLKTTLSDEGDDRESEDCDADEGVAVLPLEEDCVAAMEKEPFLKLLRLLEISPPGKGQFTLSEMIF